METNELIKWMRDFADLHRAGSVVRVNLNEAADRLEELDERVDILQESLDVEWGNNYG